MIKNLKNRSVSMRAALCLALACMASPAAAALPSAGPTDISNVPLGTGHALLPNLLFDLDDSGSMNWDFMPDYVSPNTGGVALTQSRPCMVDANKGSNSGQFCFPGDPPYAAGGANGFNGVGYDPNFRYKPGVGTNAQPLLNPPSGLPLNIPVTTTTVVNDTFAKVSGQSTSNVNLATSIADVSYCNSNNVCLRPGADSTGAVLSGLSFDSASSTGITMQAGRFPYRTNPSNASTDPTQATPAIYGLPEMMSIGAFARPAGGSSTVTVTTVEAHGLATNDKVFVTGTTSMNVTCVAVTVSNTTTFTYTSGSTGSSSQNGSYRKCLAGSWTRSSGTVTVSTSPNAPGLVVGDVITAVPSSSFTVAAFTVTAVGGTSFQYASSTGSGTVAGAWVRSGLYNRGSTATGPAVAYAIVPVEYCSDVNLTNCAYVLPGNTPPAGFTFPAYVRYCQTQAQALANGAVADASGTPRCRSKYNETAGITQYTFPRYGWFQRDTIVSGKNYGNRPNRGDCVIVGAPTCTYDEELNNYAIWYTYYRTRLQMMKASVGIAFVPFIGAPSGVPPKPNSLRLGFITMHAQDSGTISTTGNKYLRIQDFDTTQATNFYNKFYANTAGNSTPLQQALARAGWIYAGKLNTGLTKGIPNTDDPIQAACQRNYTLLTTDGFWNNLSSSLPQTPAGATIGNLDATPSTLNGSTLVDRTFTTTLDGTGSSGTTFTPSSTQSEQAICQGSNTANFSIGGPTSCGCAPTEHAVIEQDLTTGTTTTFANGVQTGSSTTTNQVYTYAAACVEGNWVEQDTPQTVTEDKACKRGGGSSVTFSDGTTASCSACSNNKWVLIRETKTQTQTVITTDGVQTQNGSAVTGTTITYSTNGSTFSATPPSGGSCANSAPTSPLSPNPQTLSGATVTTTAPGTPVAITLVPNPNTVAGGTPTSTFSAGGTASTVADTALYFFQTKLRGGTDLNGNNTGPATGPNTNPPNTVDLSATYTVQPGAKDFPNYQHMVTFGIGLADGLMRFQPDYLTATSGDFFNITNGTVGACFWTAGDCNWPAPADNTSANLDDLWHAATNGRGNYYQALNADALSKGIGTVLASVNAQVAAASASATSSPNITPTTNQQFSTTYETNTWSGSVFMQLLDPVTAVPSPIIQWTAEGQLVTKANAGTRNLLTFDPASATTRIKTFAWANFTTPQEQGWFQSKCGSLSPVVPATLGQCSSLSLADQATANSGANMVAFLSGDQTLEGSVYRDRMFRDPVTGATTQTVLGDTVNAKPLFVGGPVFTYTDAVTPSYATYALANANRAPRVYIGANDGFLHAFDANSGDESWAYAPRFLLPNIAILADTGYSSKHQFFVDGSPESFDVFDSFAGIWRTVLIGGASSGGKGWYALDVTNPFTPIALWEFCQDSTLCAVNDVDLGFSYGNPIVGKRSSDGRWVAVLSSGLNNNTNSGSGTGFFYVVDVLTGAILNKVSTGQGNSITPLGLMKMSAFYPSANTDATMRFVYGGDQYGNIWRLDLGAPGSAACDPPASGTGPCVSHLVQLNDGTSPLRVQPVTTKFPLTLINTFRVLFVGTGRFLGDGTHGGLSDLTDPGATSGIAWLQTVYGIKDNNVDYGTAFRSGATQQTLTSSGGQIFDTKNAVSWNTQNGWYFDLLQSGERVNIDPKLSLGTLSFLSNTPTSGGSSCSAGGSSNKYSVDYLTGGYIGNASTPVGTLLANELAVGFTVVSSSTGLNGEGKGQQGDQFTYKIPPNFPGTTLKRFSYRER